MEKQGDRRPGRRRGCRGVDGDDATRTGASRSRRGQRDGGGDGAGRGGGREKWEMRN